MLFSNVILDDKDKLLSQRLLQDEKVKKIIYERGRKGEYYISSLGNIYRVFRERDRHKIPQKMKIVKVHLLKTVDNGRGYKTVGIGEERRRTKNKKEYIHRLVALAFIKMNKNRQEVDHIDGNSNNNNVDNLRWVNRTENCLFRKRKGKTKEKFITINWEGKYRVVLNNKITGKVRKVFNTLEEAKIFRDRIVDKKYLQ